MEDDTYPITLSLDLNALIKYEREVAEQLRKLGLQLSHDFVPHNFAATHYMDWLEENTASGWHGIPKSFDPEIYAVTFEFDDRDEAMLFKLTFGGDA